jgi:hypothetical protein
MKWLLQVLPCNLLIDSKRTGVIKTLKKLADIEKTV